MHLIAKEMVSRGHDVTIVTGQLEGTELNEVSEYGYKIVRLPSKFINLYNPPYISSTGLLETLNEIDADIVNFNYRWTPSYSKDMRRYTGKKVFTFHNMWGEGVGLQHYASAISDRLFKRTLDTFDHIISVSDYVRSDLIGRGSPVIWSQPRHLVWIDIQRSQARRMISSCTWEDWSVQKDWTILSRPCRMWIRNWSSAEKDQIWNV